MYFLLMVSVVFNNNFIHASPSHRRNVTLPTVKTSTSTNPDATSQTQSDTKSNNKSNNSDNLKTYDTYFGLTESETAAEKIANVERTQQRQTIANIGLIIIVTVLIIVILILIRKIKHISDTLKDHNNHYYNNSSNNNNDNPFVNLPENNQHQTQSDQPPTNKSLDIKK